MGLEIALGRRGLASPLCDNPEADHFYHLDHRLAWVEMKIILAKLLWNFDLELSEKMEGGDWTDQKVYLMNEKAPMYVKMSSRVVG